MNTTFASVTVIYYPDKSFIQNFNSYAPYFPIKIIVDNSETPDWKLYESLEPKDSIIIITYQENKGVAQALNDGIKLALDKGCNWVMTMDQDSWFESTMIDNYLIAFKELGNKDQIAALGPVYSNEGINLSNNKIIQVNALITSGCILNGKVFREIGGFKEKLFIDEVDHEFCYRAKIRGYAILQLKEISIQHSLGNVTWVKTIFGKKKQKTLHHPLHLYYIVRNACFVISTYKKYFPDEIRLRKKDVLVRIKNNFLYNNKKLQVIKYVLKGLLHYFQNRYGKY